MSSSSLSSSSSSCSSSSGGAVDLPLPLSTGAASSVSSVLALGISHASHLDIQRVPSPSIPSRRDSLLLSVVISLDDLVGLPLLADLGSGRWRNDSCFLGAHCCIWMDGVG